MAWWWWFRHGTSDGEMLVSTPLDCATVSAALTASVSAARARAGSAFPRVGGWHGGLVFWWRGSGGSGGGGGGGGSDNQGHAVSVHIAARVHLIMGAMSLWT